MCLGEVCVCVCLGEVLCVCLGEVSVCVFG